MAFAPIGSIDEHKAVAGNAMPSFDGGLWCVKI
jgi:hypothetical protein